MDELEGDGPGQWGRLVRSTNGGRTQVYVADFGNGRRIITFVIWANGPRGNR
jgi:hypothetical protein